MQGYIPIGKLEPSTLVYTVAAAIISLPSINDDLSAIHKALMEEYPQYSKNEIDVVTQHPSEPLKNKEDTIVQHALNSPDRNWGLLLMQDRILFHTTHYEGFTNFSERFASVLRIIQEKTGLKYYNGLAFRHIDNIMPIEKGKSLDTAVKREFLTPSFTENMSTLFSRHEYISNIENRKLVFRLNNFYQGNSVFIPEEIFPNYFGLKGRPLVKMINEPFVLADFEANNINQELPAVKFNIENMMAELDILHKIGTIAYRKVITESELKARGCQNAS